MGRSEVGIGVLFYLNWLSSTTDRSNVEGNVTFSVVVSGLFQCTRLPLALGLKTVLGSLIPITVVLPDDIGLETP
jgi:hypothetical protein